ncbi:helix-turn-helix transcriptional regulator [Azospirillum tabaci]|uniref:helix-turn-helix transcriptional regulator n=1 Tax=Azospirillum tabaci TaxID=2752310 RepID=UPI00166134B2|nr:helix-turn-helix transcriptional regulator [Azospirillum tabaci]
MKNDIKSELTPLLCRLGRTAAELTQDQLAAEIRVSTKTIAQFEAGNTNPQRRTREDIAAALAQRVVFIPEGPDGGPGVRLRKAGQQVPASTAPRSLPDIIGTLPEPRPDELSDGADQSARGRVTYLLGGMLPKVREMVDLLRDRHPTQAEEVAAIFGISSDPVP